MPDDLGIFWAEEANDGSGHSVIFEDDGRVAYVYLLDELQNIVSDAWVYNHNQATVQPEWGDKLKIPFANPSDFVRDDVQCPPVTDQSELMIEWQITTSKKPRVRLYIRDELFAVLEPGDKPGQSLLAAKNGPLARILET